MDEREVVSGILWRRLDLPGHDSAVLTVTAAGARLRGMAVFLEHGATGLRYDVRCDDAWRTTDAEVQGWSRGRAVALQLRRDSSGHWTFDGAAADAVAGCLDLDLSFTPATNLLALRRLDVAVGETAEVRSAWLEWPDVRLSPLVQRYARRSSEWYDYEADLPGAGRFEARLRVDRDGWVRDYGGLWRAEDAG